MRWSEVLKRGNWEVRWNEVLRQGNCEVKLDCESVRWSKVVKFWAVVRMWRYEVVSLFSTFIPLFYLIVFPFASLSLSPCASLSARLSVFSLNHNWYSDHTHFPHYNYYSYCVCISIITIRLLFLFLSHSFPPFLSPLLLMSRYRLFRTGSVLLSIYRLFIYRRSSIYRPMSVPFSIYPDPLVLNCCLHKPAFIIPTERSSLQERFHIFFHRDKFWLPI